MSSDKKSEPKQEPKQAPRPQPEPTNTIVRGGESDNKKPIRKN